MEGVILESVGVDRGAETPAVAPLRGPIRRAVRRTVYRMTQRTVQRPVQRTARRVVQWPARWAGLWPILGTILGTISIAMGQEPLIYGVAIESKRNGLFIRLVSTDPIPSSHLTGWPASGGWFYLTVLNTRADSARICGYPYSYPVQEIQCINTGESIQLGFRLAHSIEHYEFYYSERPPEVLASLWFPRAEVLAYLEEEKRELNQAAVPLVTRVKKIGYLLGGALIIAGLIQGDIPGREWELPLGIILVAGSYFLDFPPGQDAGDV